MIDREVIIAALDEMRVAVTAARSNFIQQPKPEATAWDAGDMIMIRVHVNLPEFVWMRRHLDGQEINLNRLFDPQTGNFFMTIQAISAITSKQADKRIEEIIRNL